VYGLADTLERMEKMMALFGWDSWPEMYPVEFIRLPEQERVPLIETEALRIFASPVRHLIPTIGVRAEFPPSGKSLAYTSDTEPARSVVQLAQGVDVLFHEAAGQGPGHSTPAQAGEDAAQAGAKRLVLIHYHSDDPQALVAEARKTFKGPVELAVDFMKMEF
jgi:ribonuclease Z